MLGVNCRRPGDQWECTCAATGGICDHCRAAVIEAAELGHPVPATLEERLDAYLRSERAPVEAEATYDQLLDLNGRLNDALEAEHERIDKLVNKFTTRLGQEMAISDALRARVEQLERRMSFVESKAAGNESR